MDINKIIGSAIDFVHYQQKRKEFRTNNMKDLMLKKESEAFTKLLMEAGCIEEAKRAISTVRFDLTI